MFGVREFIQFTRANNPGAHKGSKDDIAIRKKGELVVEHIIKGLKSRKKITSVAKSVAVDLYELSSLGANWLKNSNEGLSKVKETLQKARTKGGAKENYRSCTSR